jgi:hypothetical protein
VVCGEMFMCDAGYGNGCCRVVLTVGVLESMKSAIEVVGGGGRKEPGIYTPGGSSRIRLEGVPLGLRITGYDLMYGDRNEVRRVASPTLLWG